MAGGRYFIMEIGWHWIIRLIDRTRQKEGQMKPLLQMFTTGIVYRLLPRQLICLETQQMQRNMRL